MAQVRANVGKSLKSTAVKALAVFFVLYALAEVSVLQAYCGNENVGIPPTIHISQNGNSFQEPTDQSIDTNQMQVGSRSGSDSDTDPSRSCDEECFGNCAHLTVPFASANCSSRAEFPINVSIGIEYDDRLVTSDFPPFFHPPKNV